MVFVKATGLNFYRQAKQPARRPRVKNQLNSLLKVTFQDPSKTRFSAFQVLAQDFHSKINFSDMACIPCQTVCNRLHIDIRL